MSNILELKPQKKKKKKKIAQIGAEMIFCCRRTSTQTCLF